MASTVAEFDEVVAGALRLSTFEKVQLVEKVMEKLGQELKYPKAGGPLAGWLGICEDLGSAPSAEIIDEERRQAWLGRSLDDV